MNARAAAVRGSQWNAGWLHDLAILIIALAQSAQQRTTLGQFLVETASLGDPNPELAWGLRLSLGRSPCRLEAVTT